MGRAYLCDSEDKIVNRHSQREVERKNNRKPENLNMQLISNFPFNAIQMVFHLIDIAFALFPSQVC